MEILELLLQNFWELTQMIAIYIMFGVFIAAILKKYIKDSFIQKQLGQNKISNIFKASILGIPLPLCSCSVVPFALSLKKSGANKASLSAFLVSTPVIGLDSFLASFGAFGWIFAIYRVFTSFCTAMIVGFLSYFFDKEKIFTNKDKENDACCSKCCDQDTAQIKIFDYAYNQLFKDIAKPMLYGLMLATFLVTFLPKDLNFFLTDSLLFSYLFILVISIPLYICATSSIPLGVALIFSGFSPGTAFLLLSAGPATSFVSIMVVKKILGLKGTTLYLSGIVISSLLFAFLLDLFFASFIEVVMQSQSGETFSFISRIFAVVFLLMIIVSFYPQKKYCRS